MRRLLVSEKSPKFSDMAFWVICWRTLERGEGCTGDRKFVGLPRKYRGTVLCTQYGLIVSLHKHITPLNGKYVQIRYTGNLNFSLIGTLWTLELHTEWKSFEEKDGSIIIQWQKEQKLWEAINKSRETWIKNEPVRFQQKVATGRRTKQKGLFDKIYGYRQDKKNR